MKNNILISIVLITLAGTAVFAYFKVAPEQQKESGTSAVISKFQEFKKSASFPVLIPSYIPDGRRYELSIPDRIKEAPAFMLTSQDGQSIVQIEVTQFAITPKQLAARNAVDENGKPLWLNGFPIEYAPLGGKPVPVGDHTGYLSENLGNPGRYRLIFKRGDIVIDAVLLYANQKSTDSLAGDLIAVVGSMK